MPVFVTFRSAVRAAHLALPLTGLMLLAGCGQRGPLFLPSGEAGAQRATLPQVLNPAAPASAPTRSGVATPPTQP